MSDFQQKYLSVCDDNYLRSYINKKSNKSRSSSRSSAVPFDETSISYASSEDLRDFNNKPFNNHGDQEIKDLYISGERSRKKRNKKLQIENAFLLRPFSSTAESYENTQGAPLFQIPQVDITLATPTTPLSCESSCCHKSSCIRSSSSSGSISCKKWFKQTKQKISSMGLRSISAERLVPPNNFKPLNKDVERIYSRSTNNVSTIGQTYNNHDPTTIIPTFDDDALPDDEMESIVYLNGIEKEFILNRTAIAATSTTSLPYQRHQHTQHKRLYRQQLSTPESATTTIERQQQQQQLLLNNRTSDCSSARSLKHSNSVSGATTPLVVIKAPTATGRRSISPSRRSASSNSSSTAKHELSSTAASTAAATAAVSVTSIAPPEKEKKPKEVSSSRVKKFHRHFSQVSKDEKLINYFSCALVSDILLQGHLYITDKHFAFYSNVFGYVTKVVIPTSSVTKISKEKTAKIIPNAVGVATAEERHVFGSFISREAAFRLMCSVCPPLLPIELLPKDPTSLEISEEYSIEDDSSCSVSGNESPALITENSSNTNINDMVTAAVHNDSSQTLLRRHITTSSNLSIHESSNKQRHSDIPLHAKNAKTSASSDDLQTTQIGDIRSSAPATAPVHFNSTSSPVKNSNKNKNSLSFAQPTCSTLLTNSTASSIGPPFDVKFIAGTLSTSTSTPTPSTPSSPTTVIAKPGTKLQGVLQTFHACTNKLLLRIKYPTELHVVYMGVVLTLLLTVFTMFLLYRILDIEAKTSLYRPPIEFNWRSGNDDDIFVEALRFQKELQHKSSEEAQMILKTNLEQIAKVRRSLETLSMLIHDRRRSSLEYPQPMNPHENPND